MEKTFILIKDRAQPHLPPHRVVKEEAVKYLNKFNKNGKRIHEGQPRFFIEPGSESVGDVALPEKKRAAQSVGNKPEATFTKTEWSDEQVIDFITSTNTLMELDRLESKLNGKFTKEIEARRAEIKASIKSKPFEKSKPESKKEQVDEVKKESKPKAKPEAVKSEKSTSKASK